MNPPGNLSLVALAPLFDAGHSPLLSWLITLVIVAVTVIFVVWLVSKFAGPPPAIPEPFRWIIWVIVAIALHIFIFAALGISI